LFNENNELLLLGGEAKNRVGAIFLKESKTMSNSIEIKSEIEGNNDNVDVDVEEKNSSTSISTNDNVDNSQISNIDSSSIKFVDTHCHLEYVCQKLRLHDVTKLKLDEPENDQLEFCICVFCDAAGLSETLGLWPELLILPKVKIWVVVVVVDCS
jgi:hypothetical protein